MSDKRYPAEVVAHVTKVAEALKGLCLFDPGWGPTYITGVTFGYDGEDAGIRLEPSDAEGSFEVVLYTPEETK